MSGASLIGQGGPIMVVLLAMSMLALAIVLLKLVQFFRLGAWRSTPTDLVLERLGRSDLVGARELLSRTSGPVARVMETALDAGMDPGMDRADTDAEVSRVGSAQIQSMESGLRGLSSIAHLSPLLGLLGTVLGMITAFRRMQEAGSRVDPSLLSGGIWEALLTTAFGLAVAIPAMGAYFFLEGRVDRTRAEMKNAAVRVLVHCRRSRPSDEPGEASETPERSCTAAIHRERPERGAIQGDRSGTGAIHRERSERGDTQGEGSDRGATHRHRSDTGAIHRERPDTGAIHGV